MLVIKVSDVAEILSLDEDQLQEEAKIHNYGAELANDCSFVPLANVADLVEAARDSNLPEGINW
jgi:hypothetical protein